MLPAPVLSYSRKKPKQGGVGGWVGFFDFTSGNSRQNKAPTLEIPQNCVRTRGNSKAKKQDPWKFHIVFN